MKRIQTIAFEWTYSVSDVISIVGKDVNNFRTHGGQDSVNRTKESNVAKVVNSRVEPVFFFVVRGFVVDTKLPALAKS